MTLHRSNKMTLWLLAVAFTILAVAILATSAMTAPAEAQDPDGSINNLLVSSPNPGQLLITWDSPEEVPTDYRVRWAPSNQDYLSYSEDNTSERGSAYPEALTFTVDNLPAGIEYKVQVRARYYDGDNTDSPWSGPWTDEATVTISSPPEQASDEVTGLALSSTAVGQLVITWDLPSDEPTDYRVVWAPANEDYLSYSADNTTRRGNSYPAGDTTTLTLTGLPGGVNYKVMMRARYHDEQTNEDRSGPWSDDATQRVRNNPPTAPTGLTVTETTSKGQTSTSLSWTAPSHDDLTGYQIWHGPDADSLITLVQDTGDTATTYTDATAETGNVYAVTALSSDGDSPRSATASVERNTITIRDEPQEELIAQQQQGSHVLVSNLSNKGDSVSAIDNLSSGNQIRLEQSFRTGRHSGGYSVTEIQAFIASITGSVGPWVRIHADNNNKPGTRLRSFTEVTGFANNSTASFTSSEGAITLNPNTKYWLVFGMTSADNSHRYRIDNSNGNIDSCGELDWNIYDESLGAQYDTSDVRQRDHTDDPIMVAIIGSQVDNGSASELECEDTSATTTEDITLTSNLDTAHQR